MLIPCMAPRASKASLVTSQVKDSTSPESGPIANSTYSKCSKKMFLDAHRLFRLDIRIHFSAAIYFPPGSLFITNVADFPSYPKSS